MRFEFVLRRIWQCPSAFAPDHQVRTPHFLLSRVATPSFAYGSAVQGHVEVYGAPKKPRCPLPAR